MGWSSHHATGLIYYAPQHSYRGYTLFTPSSGDSTYLIDMDGRICHRWHFDRGIGYACLLPTGNLLLRSSGAVAGVQPAVGGAGAVAIVELDWDGNIVWEYRDPMLHHDFERLPNGNTLVLLFEPLDADLIGRVRGGFGESDGTPEMLGDLVREVSPGGETVYSWPSWEHLDTDEDAICHLEGRAEWTHQNSLNATPAGDLVVSFRSTSTVGIVDKETGAFSWKWGPGVISHQHNPTFLDNGNVLIFDNGPHRPGYTYSRVVEVDPNTNEIAWEYQGDPPISFYSYHISGAERLPNGNTLICEGAPGRVFEVTPAREIVWEYVNPIFGPGSRGTGGTPLQFHVPRPPLRPRPSGAGGQRPGPGAARQPEPPLRGLRRGERERGSRKRGQPQGLPLQGGRATPGCSGHSVAPASGGASGL